MIEFADTNAFWTREKTSLYEYCSDNQGVFSNLQHEILEILPEFCRLIRHFAYTSGAVVREMIDSRSPLEIEILNGLSEEDEQILMEFFGLPKKAAGRRMSSELESDPIFRFLGGAYQEQTVFIREFSSGGVRFYAAVWPWHTNPDILTLHFGLFDNRSPQTEQEKIKQFLHQIPY